MIYSHKAYTEKPDLEMFNMHTHDDYEIYCFLSGSAKYYVEGNIYSLKSGDILIIKKAEAHTLLINKDIPYARYIVNFTADSVLGENVNDIVNFLDSKPLGVNNRYSFSQFNSKHWLYYLEKICENENQKQKQIYLTVLLNELLECYQEIDSSSAVYDSTQEIIAYVNQHLTESISLENICERFYLSRSQLQRKFKRTTGSTVWDYIQTKRLLLAKELLQKGEHPTSCYLKCGFNDYGSFFRAYKLKFNTSPKSDFVYKKIPNQT